MNDIVKTSAFIDAQPYSPDDFEAAIRAVGTERYHDKHASISFCTAAS